MYRSEIDKQQQVVKVVSHCESAPSTYEEHSTKYENIKKKKK